MTNEEILEEIYFQVHKSGIFNEFINEVNKLLKLTKQTLYEIVNKVYYEFVSKGLIIEVCPI
jgi:DNA-directed RNA polymerase delta subunit